MSFEWRKSHQIGFTNLRGRSVSIELWQWLDAAPAAVGLLPVVKGGRAFRVNWRFSNDRGEGLLIPRCSLELVNESAGQLYNLLTRKDPSRVQLRVFWDGKRVFKGFPDTLNVEAQKRSEFFSFTLNFTGVGSDKLQNPIEELYDAIDADESTAANIGSRVNMPLANLLVKYLLRGHFETNTGALLNDPNATYMEIMQATGFKIDPLGMTFNEWFHRVMTNLNVFQQQFYAEKTGRSRFTYSDALNHVLKIGFGVAGWSIHKQTLIFREMDADPAFTGRNHYQLKGSTDNLFFDFGVYTSSAVTGDTYDLYRLLDGFVDKSRRIWTLQPYRDIAVTSIFRSKVVNDELTPEDPLFYFFNDLASYDGTPLLGQLWFYDENRDLSLRSYMAEFERKLIAVSEVGRRNSSVSIVQREPYALRWVDILGQNAAPITGQSALFDNPRQSDGTALFTTNSSVTTTSPAPIYRPGQQFYPLSVSHGVSAWFLWNNFRDGYRLNVRKIIDPMFVQHFDGRRWIATRGAWDFYTESTEDLQLYNADPYIFPAEYKRIDGSTYPAN